MKRYLILTFAGLALSLWSYLAGCTVVARPAPPPPPLAVQPQEPPMTTNVEPPPVREEVMVPAPSPQHVWIQGHWAWNGRWVWQPGSWVVPPVRMPNGFLALGASARWLGLDSGTLEISVM